MKLDPCYLIVDSAAWIDRLTRPHRCERYA